MKITLTDSEQRIVRWLAEQRRSSNRRSGVANGRVGPQDDGYTDLNGVGAEFAFAKARNLWPDMTIGPRHGGPDCLAHNGAKIDVKCTKYANGQLLAVAGKSAYDADYYVLLVGEFPAYTLIGWAAASELITPERLTDLGHGPTYAMPQSELHALEG